MPWNYDASKLRVAESVVPLDEIEVKPLTRSMDLEHLSVRRCRIVKGAHLYADITNFDNLLSDTRLASDAYSRLIRALHVYQLEVTRIVEQTFGGVKVHFQGSRLHAVFFAPIDDESEIAKQAALCAVTVELLSRGPFSKLFPDYKDFRIASGLDIGPTVATKNGTGGDRELLFLGNAANAAAKIVPQGGYQIAATARFLAHLDDGLADLVKSDGRTMANIRDALADSDASWDEDTSYGRMQHDVDAVPLKDIGVSAATANIDKSRLSIRYNKRVLGVSAYGDVAGFTALIASARDEDDYKRLIQWFHLIRTEMREVVVTDFGGLRIQYQGDRIQGLIYLPAGDLDQICATTVRVAAALQSSVEEVLNAYAPDKKVHLAVGADLGTTLVSSLGTRGDRDLICIGQAPRRAAAYEDQIGGTQSCISPAIYERIPEKWRELFRYDQGTQAWVAGQLTQQDLDDIDEATTLADARQVTLRASSAGVGLHLGTTRRDESGTQYSTIRPTRPWGC